MQVLAILPTYNEKDNIRELIERIINLDLDISILVVDDNSEDGTGQIVEEMANSDSRISVIRRREKRGRGLAGIEGFKYALNQDADYVIEMDADFSHNPRYIPVLLKEIVDCDVVIGSRYVRGGSNIGSNPHKKCLSLLAQLFCRSVLGINMSDTTSGFRCFKRRVLENIGLDRLISEGPSIVEEINYYLQKKGFKIKEIPIVFQQRRSGSSKLNFIKTLDVFWTLIKVRLAA